MNSSPHIHHQNLSATGLEKEGFEETLQHLRIGRCEIEDWTRLSTRLQATLPAVEVESFRDALRIYSTRLEAHKFNLKRLGNLGIPVLKIAASHDGPNAEAAAKADTQEAGNLQQYFFVGIGCDVVLTENLWPARGLMNGTTGRVYDISWNAGVEDPPKHASAGHFNPLS
jgi:ATP-dependent DNA helicase PIF1